MHKKEANIAYATVLGETPAPVVIGLDMIRAWRLCYNPLNDCVVALQAKDSCVLATSLVASEDGSGNEDRTAILGGASFVGTEAEEDEGFRVVMEDHHSFSKKQRRSQAMWIVEKGEYGEQKLCCFSVTASTEEEKQATDDFFANCDPRLLELYHQFPSVFAPPDAVPPQRSVIHTIRLKEGAIPVRRPPYPLGAEKAATMKEQISDLATKGWVVESESPWGAPILFVKKAGGAWRLCTDFRDLNAVTVDDSFPLPRVEMLLQRAGGARVFSKIDLASGFHQIAVDRTSQEKTAFRLPLPVHGCTLWEWTVMPFGLKNALPTFQRAMEVALRGCEEFAVVYIDDILVFSEDEPTHLLHLRHVFAKLQEGSYHVRFPKCELMKESVEFLGHRLSGEELTTAETKVGALCTWKAPLRSAKQT